MGVAGGVKCKACGAGGVMVRFMEEQSLEPEHLCYICSACDYRWFEKPLYLRSPNWEALAAVHEKYEKYARFGYGKDESLSSLEHEVEHLESLVKQFTRRDYRNRWKHVQSCFHQSTLRLRDLVNKTPPQPRGYFMRTLDDLEAWVGLSAEKAELIRITTYKDLGRGREYSTASLSIEKLVGILVDYLRRAWS